MEFTNKLSVFRLVPRSFVTVVPVMVVVVEVGGVIVLRRIFRLLFLLAVGYGVLALVLGEGEDSGDNCCC